MLSHLSIKCLICLSLTYGVEDKIIFLKKMQSVKGEVWNIVAFY